MTRRDLLTAALAGTVLGGRTFGSALAQEGTGTLKPPRLKKGDRVALVNPASATALSMDVEIVTESLQALGLEVTYGEHILDRYGYFAGTDEERARDLNRQFRDSEVAGVVAVRGGWGSARVLPLLDYPAMRKDPKVLVGYSDITALLLGIFARTGLVGFHGPIGLGPWNSFTVDYFRRVVFEGEKVIYRNPSEVGDNLTQVRDRIRTITPGAAEGPLLGGNLTVLSAIVGSSYLPDWNGAILFLEDIGENIYRIDRMLTQLRLAGILDQIAAFVFGKCTDCDPGEGYGSLTLEQVLDDHVKPLGIPAWEGAMIGHVPRKFTLPVGVRARVDAGKGEIELLETGVS